jgi:hypothetical protein
MNGWQRLWITIGIIYLLIVIVITWSYFPTLNGIYEKWYIEDYLCYSESKSKNYIEFKKENSNLDYPQLIELVVKTYSANQNTKSDPCSSSDNPFIRDNPFMIGEETRNKYEGQLKSLSGEQAHILIMAFFIWLVPMVLIYLLAFLIRWVYQGLKS